MRFYIVFLLLVSICILIVFIDQNKKEDRTELHEYVCSKCNVVLIVVDALRFDHVGFSGYERNTTPFIDSLSESSLNYLNAYSQESYTAASIASVFTSKYPPQHGVIWGKEEVILSDDFTTLAEVFNNRGYATAAFVFNPSLSSEKNFDQGFDIYDDNEEGFVGRTKTEQFETASKLEKKSLSWLRNNTGKPFFLYLHYRDVHDPYLPPRPFDTYFLSQNLSAQDGVNDFFRHQNITKQEREVLLYDQEIAYNDYMLRLLFDEINNLSGKTLYVIIADHGEEFWDHGGQKHGHTQYQELIHVPLLIYSPQHNYSEAINCNVELIDVGPTVFSMIGWEIPKEYQGISQVPPACNKKMIYSGGTAERGAIIRDDIKYYRYKSHSLKQIMQLNHSLATLDVMEELYNLTRDPKERDNMILDDPEAAYELGAYLTSIESSKTEHSMKTVVLEDITKERLRALGYLN